MTTKEKILVESIKLFAKKGFDGTGIEEISNKVGITKSVIYYHFKNKEDILNAVYKNLSEEHLKFKKDLEKKYGDSLKDNVNSYFKEILFNFWNDKKDIIKILVMESMKESGNYPLFDFWRTNVNNPMLSAISDLDYSDEEIFQVSLNSFFLVFMTNVMHIIFSEEWSKYNDYDKEKVKDRYLESYLKTLKALEK